MIGKNLKKIRGFNGYTIARLALESCISEYSIIKIETGKTVDPRRSTLQKLANALGVDIDIFYAEDINISQDDDGTAQRKLPLSMGKSRKRVSNA